MVENFKGYYLKTSAKVLSFKRKEALKFDTFIMYTTYKSILKST